MTTPHSDWREKIQIILKVSGDLYDFKDIEAIVEDELTTQEKELKARLREKANALRVFTFNLNTNTEMEVVDAKEVLALLD